MQLDDRSLDIIFQQARTHSVWLDKPVSDAQLHQIYDLMKWGPTSANSCPARIVFVRSAAAKERLLRAIAPGNTQKTLTAPVTAITMEEFVARLGSGSKTNFSAVSLWLESSYQDSLRAMLQHPPPRNEFCPPGVPWRKTPFSGGNSGFGGVGIMFFTPEMGRATFELSNSQRPFR